jgi:hypothetical protein
MLATITCWSVWRSGNVPDFCSEEGYSEYIPDDLSAALKPAVCNAVPKCAQSNFLFSFHFLGSSLVWSRPNFLRDFVAFLFFLSAWDSTLTYLSDSSLRTLFNCHLQFLLPSDAKCSLSVPSAQSQAFYRGGSESFPHDDVRLEVRDADLPQNFSMSPPPPQ